MLVEVERREDDHPGVARRRTDATGRLEAVHAWHPDVHEHDVRAERLDQGERLGPVVGLADDGDVRLGVEDHPQPGADELLVVDEQHPDHVGPLSNGSRACTENPPPGRGPVCRLPPYSATRSRMPTSPREPLSWPLTDDVPSAVARRR